VTRTNQNAPSDVKSYLLSDKFALAAFKGRPLSFRAWNGQMRQPIPVVASGALVSQAPIEGFLHERNELDSLGLDHLESKCEAFGG
jgi:ABC transporter substrate binding protein (PQQ-dependent alcohol dehydrogenase system)